MKNRLAFLFICFLAVFLFVVWCWNNNYEEVAVEELSTLELDNALNLNSKANSSVSQYCEDNWWISEFRELADWNELWTCFFVDWSYCDVWDYRGWSCNPGDNPIAKNNLEKVIENAENIEKAV